MKLPPAGDTEKRLWSRKELEALVRAVALPAISDKRRQILEDYGMLYLDGKLEFRERNGDVCANVHHTDIAEFMKMYFEPGKRIRVLFVPENVLGDLDERNVV